MTEPPPGDLAGRIAAASRPAVFCGAGLSAESGVPTFRGGGDHPLWSRHDPMRLASLDGFERDPGLVLDWYDWRRGLVREAEPNAAHRALARWSRATLVTQNVDDLQERAGADPGRILHLHGSIMHDRCHDDCGWSAAAPPEPDGARAPCPCCRGPRRPAVVWFGEPLPREPWERATAACGAADLLLVVGTSGVVHPAAGLVELAVRAGAFVINVNPEPTVLDALSDVTLRSSATEVLPGLLPD